MRELTGDERASRSLARRALLIMAILAMTGTGLGIFGAIRGTVVGFEAALVFVGLLFSSAVFFTVIVCRNVPFQKIATVSTIFLGAYLCAGSVIAVSGPGKHLSILIYLVWFFPLLVFNKVVNEPTIGRLLAKSLLLAPLLILACLAPRLIVVFKIDVLILLIATCLSYQCFALMFEAVTKYREEYIIERERAESLRAESDVLESISDCFISLDSSSRLVYLNDAACDEFGVERRAALRGTIPGALPGFFSASMLAGLQGAAEKSAATVFEAQNQKQNRWYEMRCFPRKDGMSVCFRNITESMSARQELDQANTSLRQQAELLDKAQDAIFVQDLSGCIIYWNKGAERLYGWTAEEVTGRLLADVFEDLLAYTSLSVSTLLERGEWDGELSQRRRDGTIVIVESRCTLVTGDDGEPRSILAINTDITNRKAAEAKIQHLAFFDVLTGLPNRLLLRERLETALASAMRRGTMGALLFIDLDDFKTLNDSRGHDTGDLLLQQVAIRLKSCVRAGDTVARLGGDEFVVMLEGLDQDFRTTAADAKAVGDKILAAFLQPYQVGDYEHNTTVSVGITLFPGSSDTVDDLLKRADLAMYRAKALGRNAMCFFDPAMQTFVAARAELQSDLRRAMNNHEFELHYQPQVDSQGRAIAAEALLRWNHPRRGMVPPTEFISLAEEAGLIVDLGRWVLETTCSQLAKWATQPGLDKLSVAVNVSLRQFLDSNFVSLVLDVLQKSGANPERLKLEITESSVMENADDTIEKMTTLRNQRVGFSLDDFGTGYSSLSHLKSLPLDQLKIDRSFVRDVLDDRRDASIARAIITLGQSLNLSVIAEGVETAEQLDFLVREGCHTFQGFLFSPALRAADFEAFVARTRAARISLDAA